MVLCVLLEVECQSSPEPTQHMSRVLSKSWIAFGQVLVYECDEGYSYISGDGKTRTTVVIECNADGLFEPSVLPQCQRELQCCGVFTQSLDQKLKK